MLFRDRLKAQTVLLGCGLVAVIGLVVLAGSIAWLISLERHAYRYPNASLLGKKVPTTIKLNYIRMENTYLSQDSMFTIRDWYASTHQMQITEVGQECVGLEGVKESLLTQRMTSVTICDLPQGRMIFITRLTSRH